MDIEIGIMCPKNSRLHWTRRQKKATAVDNCAAPVKLLLMMNATLLFAKKNKKGNRGQLVIW